MLRDPKIKDMEPVCLIAPAIDINDLGAIKDELLAMLGAAFVVRRRSDPLPRDRPSIATPLVTTSDPQRIGAKGMHVWLRVRLR